MIFFKTFILIPKQLHIQVLRTKICTIWIFIYEIHVYLLIVVLFHVLVVYFRDHNSLVFST